MIKIFYERIPSSLAQIKESYSAGNFKSVRDIIHLLKPGIENMGIRSIKENIKNVELIAKENPNSELLIENINKIEEVLMMVFEQLKEELK